MLDVLEVQDQLKNFSQEQLLREMQMPTGNIPQFLVLSELNRRRTMSQDLAKRQSADQPTVKEEVVASSGMPMEKASMMAQQMAPKTSMTENTGISSMMPRELPSEEEPMKMSFGGMLMGSRMTTGMFPNIARAAVIRPEEERRSLFPVMQGRFSSGLDNLGRDISGRVQNRTQEEVDDFIGEVDNMAQERFEVNLSEPSQRQRDMQSFLSGKGQPPRAIAMKDGGVIKAQSGLFAQGTPSFATIYNYAKTQLGLDDELARDVARKTLEESDSMGYRTGALSSFPIGAGIGPDATDEDQQIQSEIVNQPDIIPNIAELESQFGDTFPLPTSRKDRRPDRVGSGMTIPQFVRRNFPVAAENLGFGEEELLDDLKTVKKSAVSDITRADYEDIFKFGRGDPSRKIVTDQLKTEDEKKIPAERDFRKRQEQMIYEESMKRANRLAKKDEEEEEKKKKQKEEEDRILGGFGKASGALSDLSAQIAELKEKREKGRESEKWFSLAKLGLGMLASANPTVFGALGEGGLKALEDFKAGKKAYDDDILGYLKTQASIAKSQAELGVKGLVAQKQIEALKSKTSGGMTQKERTTAILNINKELNDLYELGKYDVEDPKIKRAIFDLETQKRRLQLGLPVGPTVIDKDLTATTAIG